MNLTFKGFLKLYCAELCQEKTSSLAKLSKHAANDAPRVAEPLFLLALAEGKIPYLLRLCKGSWMEEDFKALALASKEFGEDSAAFAQSPYAPSRYQKVFQAYNAKLHSSDAGRRINSLLKNRILAELKRSNRSIYQLCKDLSLNKGNVYAYLNKGDSSKVSKETAYRMLEYARA